MGESFIRQFFVTLLNEAGYLVVVQLLHVAYEYKKGRRMETKPVYVHVPTSKPTEYSMLDTKHYM